MRKGLRHRIFLAWLFLYIEGSGAYEKRLKIIRSDPESSRQVKKGASIPECPDCDNDTYDEPRGKTSE